MNSFGGFRLNLNLLNSIRLRSKRLSSKLLLHLLLIGYTTTLSGCTGMKLPDPIDSSALKQAGPERAADVATEIAVQAAKLKSFRGSYEGLIDSPAGKIQFRLVVAYLRPDNLRLEVLFTGLNRMASMLTLSGGQISLLDPIGRKLYTGPVDEKQIARLTGVPLSAVELMLWFGGRYLPETTVGDAAESYRVFLGEQPVVLFDRPNGDVAVVRLCAGRPGVVEALELTTQGRQSLVTRYDCQPGAGPIGQLPASIHFWLPEDRTEGVLTLEAGKLNPNLTSAPKALFSPRPPEGIESLSIDQASRGALFGE